MITDDPNSLASQLAQLRQENELLRAERQQLLEEQYRNTRTIESLQHQLQCLLRRLFGRSAEKIDPKQMLLFNDLLQQLAPETPASQPAAVPDTVSVVEESGPTTVNVTLGFWRSFSSWMRPTRRTVPCTRMAT